MKKFSEIINPPAVQEEKFISIEEEVKSNLAAKIGKVALGAVLGGVGLASLKSLDPPTTKQAPERLSVPMIQQQQQQQKQKEDSDQETKPQEKIYHHEAIKNMVIADEGIKTKPYLDTSGIRTVGIGHNLEAPASKKTFIKTFGNEGAALHARVKAGASITHDQAHQLFNTDYEDHLNKTIRMIPNLHEHPPDVQAVLVSGTYRGHVGDAPIFRQKFNRGDIEGAAHEVLNRGEYTNPAKDEKGNIAAPGVLSRLERDHSVLMNYAKSRAAK